MTSSGQYKPKQDGATIKHVPVPQQAGPIIRPYWGKPTIIVGHNVHKNKTLAAFFNFTNIIT